MQTAAAGITYLLIKGFAAGMPVEGDVEGKRLLDVCRACTEQRPLSSSALCQLQSGTCMPARLLRGQANQMVVERAIHTLHCQRLFSRLPLAPPAKGDESSPCSGRQSCDIVNVDVHQALARGCAPMLEAFEHDGDTR